MQNFGLCAQHDAMNAIPDIIFYKNPVRQVKSVLMSSAHYRSACRTNNFDPIPWLLAQHMRAYWLAGMNVKAFVSTTSFNFVAECPFK